MLGAIIGDVVGSMYEKRGHRIKTKDFPLFTFDNQFTDDTIMTFATATAIMTFDDPDNFLHAYKTWGREYPDVGYGKTFRKWLASDNPSPYNSYGNGSAMRVSPVGWVCDTLDETEKLAETSASVTHNHPEGIKGAQATAAAIFMARTGESKAKIKEYIEKKYGYNLSRTLDEIRPNYSFDVTCQGSVPESIIAFLESTDFEDAIRNAVSLGGDSDTMATIAGSIAKAYYGIPEWMKEEVFTYLDRNQKEMYAKWETYKKNVVQYKENNNG
jgi:ADP-ribosylglycohydrolase